MQCDVIFIACSTASPSCAISHSLRGHRFKQDTIAYANDRWNWNGWPCDFIIFFSLLKQLNESKLSTTWKFSRFLSTWWRNKLRHLCDRPAINASLGHYIDERCHRRSRDIVSSAALNISLAAANTSHTGHPTSSFIEFSRWNLWGDDNKWRWFN